jgi:hypothetical protein
MGVAALFDWSDENPPHLSVVLLVNVRRQPMVKGSRGEDLFWCDCCRIHTTNSDKAECSLCGSRAGRTVHPRAIVDGPVFLTPSQP